MAGAARTFRVFVSSTFKDLDAERNVLQEQVFPQLKEFCRSRGHRFQDIDLRWGVSEEASLDQQALNICLAEIERCREITPRPNFIVLLGNRYGWLAPPPQIPAEQFQQIRDNVPPAIRRSWATGMRKTTTLIRPSTTCGRGRRAAHWRGTKPGNLSSSACTAGWPEGSGGHRLRQIPGSRRPPPSRRSWPGR